MKLNVCWCCCCCYERPQKWQKLEPNEWNWKKRLKILWKYCTGTGLYANGRKKIASCVSHWFDIYCTLSFCLFAWVIFSFFQPNATRPNPSPVHMFPLYIDINQIFIWNFPVLFSTTPPVPFAVDRFVLCIAMRACKIQLQLKQNEKKIARKLNWNIWVVLKQVLYTVHTVQCKQQTSSFWCPLLIPIGQIPNWTGVL